MDGAGRSECLGFEGEGHQLQDSVFRLKPHQNPRLKDLGIFRWSQSGLTALKAHASSYEITAKQVIWNQLLRANILVRLHSLLNKTNCYLPTRAPIGCETWEAPFCCSPSYRNTCGKQWANLFFTFFFLQSGSASPDLLMHHKHFNKPAKTFREALLPPAGVKWNDDDSSWKTKYSRYTINTRWDVKLCHSENTSFALVWNEMYVYVYTGASGCQTGN